MSAQLELPEDAPTVWGIGFFRDVTVLVGIVGFVAVYAYFIVEITGADGSPPDFDNQLTYLTSAVGGILASYFAIVLGITQSDETQGIRDRLRSGLRPPPVTRNAPKTVTIIGTLAFWAYVIVGVGTLVIAFFKTQETPDVIKGTSAVFAGYVASVFGAQFAFRTGVTPSTQVPTSTRPASDTREA